MPSYVYIQMGKCERCLQKQYLDNGFCVLYCTGFNPICIIVIIIIINILMIITWFVLTELSRVTSEAGENVADILINNHSKFLTQKEILLPKHMNFVHFKREECRLMDFVEGDIPLTPLPGTCHCKNNINIIIIIITFEEKNIYCSSFLLQSVEH